MSSIINAKWNVEHVGRMDSFDNYGNRNGLKSTSVKSKDMQVEGSTVLGLESHGGTYLDLKDLSRENCSESEALTYFYFF